MKRLLIAAILTVSSCKDTRLVDVLNPDACVPFDEQCNGLDDDCDGKTDEIEDIGIKPCYSGNQSELLYGVCKFGVERCVDAGWSCFGEIKPAQEVCNDIDDNCNGQTDELKGEGADIIFAMDYSCSMSDRLITVNKIISDWSVIYADAGVNNIKVALVGIPSDNSLDDSAVKIMLPLSDVPVFVNEINRHKYPTGSGNEPSLDAIYFLADRRNPLGLNWTPNYARALLIFTDEPQQSYTSPPVTEISAMNMVMSNNVSVFIFTNDFTWRNWRTYPLFSTAEILSNNIQEAIDKGMCQ